ncbi:MAG: regulatory iron-sulfur-containing complex subunit RicT [Chitinophagales bacterium]
MGCSTCSNKSKTKDGKPAGCASNGDCTTGGCNRLNVYDWLADLPYSVQQDPFKVVEVSFKNGSRKAFYRNTNNIDCHTGDTIVVEAATGGHDIGRISLSGELVRLQMKKRNVPLDAELPRIMRLASMRDMERFEDAKSREYETMLMARVISRRLDLQMKVGDVEYQGDGRKATFYYTADDRIDFRELIKLLAKEFRVKIEMRQIGARQEASRIGGIGSCGRELCCSTWLTKFKSVSTTAARYQNLAINQSKLSGQCGRLKCCLNFELNMYMEALKGFPKNADFIETQQGRARLIKTDIFKRKMWYSLMETNKVHSISVDRVNEIIEMNKEGKSPETLVSYAVINSYVAEIGFEDGVGGIELDSLAPIERNKRRRRKRRPSGNADRKRSNTSAKDAKKSPANTSKPRPPRSKSKPPRTKPKTGDSSPRSNAPKKPSPKKTSSETPSINKPKSGGQRPENKEGGVKKRTPRNRRSNKPKGNEGPRKKDNNDGKTID